MKFLEAFAFLPYLYIFSTLALGGQTAKPNGLLVQPNSFFFAKFFFELGESLDMGFYKDFLLGLLLLEDCLNFFDLSVEGVEEMIATINFLFFLLE